MVIIVTSIEISNASSLWWVGASNSLQRFLLASTSHTLRILTRILYKLRILSLWRSMLLILNFILSIACLWISLILLSIFFKANCWLIYHWVIISLLLLSKFLDTNSLRWTARNIGFWLLPLFNVLYRCLIIFLVILTRNQNRRIVAIRLIIHLRIAVWHRNWSLTSCNPVNKFGIQIIMFYAWCNLIDKLLSLFLWGNFSI